jgi:uncharacterized repeat protein (TIGR02543 family)
MANQSFTYGTAQNLKANAFTRSGFTFLGWATSAGGVLAYKNNQNVNNLTATAGGTVTLYAKWVENAMVSVSVGTFTMGSPITEPGCNGDEQPQHSVTLSAFSIGKYQVTQELYEAVMGDNPSYFTTANGEPPDLGEIDGKRPVEQVRWYDAIVFCNRLSMLEGLSPAYQISGSTDPGDWGAVPTGSDATWDAVEMVSGSNGYRLPTEAQWEYACRAGTTTAFSNGEDDWNTVSTDIGWYDGNSNSKTHEVGKKAANAWGLCDMHGNVFEWCWDWYDAGYYASSPSSNPAGPGTGAYRVIRGGSWCFDGRALRSADRYDVTPDFGFNDNGFRVARPLS